ncbi:MAG: tandem-95 repeat protein [Verrucomicrobiales bacterium]|nr:tandem-95 repeat protein [Verrucomicrobiales bacterium]
MASVMISYRRGDSAAFAGRLYDRLLEEFGRDVVFRDLESIEPGLDFAEALQRVLGRCDAVIVVVGKDWTSVTAPDGRRRLDIPEDWVRLEVATALERGIRVIPFLMPGVSMPSEEELPAPLKSFARRNAISTSDTHFDADVERLIKILPSRFGQRRNRRLAGWIAAGAGALALAVWGLWTVLSAGRSGAGPVKLRPMVLETREDTPLPVRLSGADLADESLKFEIVPGTGPSRGVLSGNPPELTYTPNANQAGSDGFTYSMRRASGKPTANTVTINIHPENDPPIARPLSLELDEDTQAEIRLEGEDVDADALTYQLTGNTVSHGTLQGDGRLLRYLPTTNYAGLDQFRYVVTDGQATSAPAPVVLTIRPINDPPVPRSLEASTPAGRMVPIRFVAEDPESDPIEYEIVKAPSFGILNLSKEPGHPSAEYWPRPQFMGTDTFRYQALDGRGVSATAEVRITVRHLLPPKLLYEVEMPKTVKGFQPFDLTLVATNGGDLPLTNLTASLALPRGLIFVSSQPTARTNDSQVIWPIPNLEGGQTARLTAQFRPLTVGTVDIEASVKGPGVSPSGESMKRGTIVLEGVAALLLEVIDDPDPIEVSGATTYTFRVTNMGNANLSEVTVSARLVGTQFVGGSGGATPASEPDQVRIPTIPRLLPKQTATWTLRCRSVSKGQARCTVTVTSASLEAPIEKTESTTVF